MSNFKYMREEKKTAQKFLVSKLLDFLDQSTVVYQMLLFAIIKKFKIILRHNTSPLTLFSS